jgi:Secretion system C-terminal sorting domain/Domain of unknown function DUF11/HYR domain
MKNFILCVVFLAVHTCGAFGQVNFTANNQVTPYTGRFRAGVNLGYYPLWGNQQMADVAAGNPATNQIGVGARAVRQGLPDLVLGLPLYGYNFLRNDFNHYNSLNMSNGEAVGIVGDPLEWHRDNNNYCPSQPNKKSKFFGNMYTPIWDGGANGTPYNDDNYFAAYMYNVASAYKDDVRFWEIWNEPGLDFGACGWRAPGDPICNWWDRDPSPCELDLGAPIEHYVRALRIAYEVIKTVDSDSYVCLGSMGYAAGLDAVLRNTDNPNGGGVTPEYPLLGGAYFDCVTMHTYPHFDGSTVNFSGNFFQRHSDRAADGVFLFRDNYQTILNNYGYNGTTFPKKEFIITEANIPKVSYPAGSYIAGEQAQVNWIQKAVIVAKLEKIGSYHVYQMFDRKTSANASYEFDEMGMYKTIEPNGTNTVGPFGQQVNNQGIALKTVSDLIYPTDYDPTETAKMGLSTTSAARGYAFKRPDGKFVYVLWARTTTDLSEAASATYSFPASMNVGTLTRHAWNWGYTNQTTQVANTGIVLDANPQYFVGGSGVATCGISATVNTVVCNNNGTPTNSADDTYTFNVNVTSSGPCSAGWTATAGVTGTGTYNVNRAFGPFPISGGSKVITIRDNTNTAATVTVTASAPATCSGSNPTCSLTASVTNILCNNNGTATVAADDTYTFDITVVASGTCSTAGWNATGGATGSGTYGATRVFGPFPISGGNRILTITDAGSAVNITATAIAPATCSGGNTVTCSNNLLANPGFESALTSWSLGTGVTSVTGGNSGPGAASICTNGQRMWQTLSATAGTYTFHAYAKNATAAAGSGTLALKFMNSSFTPLQQDFSPIIATNTYALYSITRTAPAGTAFVEVSILKETGACIVVDDVCLGTGSAPTSVVTIANCPQNITLTAAAGATTAIANYTAPTATATNCATAPVVTRTSGLASGSAFPIGTSQVVYTATACGVTSSCVFTVTVQQTTPSTTVSFTACPQNITINAAAGATSAVANYATPTASATNCASAPVVTRTSAATTASGSSFPVGVTNVTWTATACGVTSTCAFTVTVQAGTPTTCTNNIVVNSSFETDLTTLRSWNSDGSNTIVAGGANGTAQAASICTNGTRIYQTTAATPGLTYSLATMAKNNGTTATGTLVIKFMNSSYTPLVSNFGSIASVTNVYKMFTISEVAPAGTAFVEYSILKQTGAGCLIVDEVCLTNGVGGQCLVQIASNNVVCNNNGTPNVVTDDTYTFNITVTNTGSCGTSWTGTGGRTGTYGVPITVGPISVSTDFTFSATDVNNPLSTNAIGISSPGSCSTPTTCTLNHTVSNVVCINNGTASTADDLYTFDLAVTPSGACGTGTTWFATNAFTTGSFPYTTPKTSVQLLISGGPVTFTIISNTGGASKVITVTPPAPCSNAGGGIDLALTTTASPNNPGIWGTTAVSITVTNTSTTAATGVVVRTPQQSNTAFANNVAYVNHTAAVGTSFEPWFGNWNVGALPAGQSRTLIYNAFMKTAASTPFFSQVFAADQPDSDSQPNNNSTGTPAQDDEARVNINGPLALQSSDPSQMTEQELAAAFVLYPNPAAEYSNMSMEPYMRKQVQIRVINHLGREVATQTIDDLRSIVVEIPLSGYQNGVYFVEVTSPGQRAIIRKLIVTTMD